MLIAASSTCVIRRRGVYTAARQSLAPCAKVVDVNLEKVPEPWRTQMQQKGISSIRDFSRKSGVSVETVRQAVYGTRRSSPATAQALADALGVEVAHVNEWLGYGRSDTSAPYEPPAEASRLTTRQRSALDELIRSMTAGATHDREAESQQGPEASGQEHARTDRPEDGSTSRRGGPIVDLDQARRVKDDPGAFGDQPRRGDMDRRQREADEKPLEELLDLAADKGDRMDDD